MIHPLIENKKQAIFDLCKQNHVKSLCLFGSITTPDKFNENSDIDLLVAFKEDEISHETYTQNFFNLVFNLEKLLGREIDMTTERSVRNPYFREELERTKVLFFDDLKAIA